MFLKSHSIFVSPHLARPTVFLTFLYTCTWFVFLSPRCCTRRRVHPLPLSKEGYALADWLNNILLQVTSPSLSSKSAANTLRLSYLGEEAEAASTRTFTISRPPCVCLKSVDMTDVGRLTSPRFSQDREVSAIPFGVSCSQTHSSMEKSSRDVEHFFKLRETVVER